MPTDSILRRLLPELLDLSPVETDRLWEAFDGSTVDDLALKDTVLQAMRRLYLCGQDSLELLLTTPIGYLQSLFASDASFDEFLAAAVAQISTALGRIALPGLDALSSAAFLAGVPEALGSFPLSIIPGTASLVSCFPGEGVQTVSDLTGHSEKSLFEAAGLEAHTLRATRMCWSLKDELTWIGALVVAPSRATSSGSLSDELVAALSAALPPARATPSAKRVIARRLGVESGRPMTLEETAEPFGLTRERIRQIESEALHKLHVAMKDMR